MPVLLVSSPFFDQLELRRVSKIFVGLLLLSLVSVTFSPAVQAQSIDIGSGVLDNDKKDGPKWTRIDFDPLIAGDHSIRIISDTSADVRFSVFRIEDAPSPNNRVRLGTSNSSATLAEWVGTLDLTERYYLGIWAASGSGSFNATIEAQALEIVSQPSDRSVIEGYDSTFTVAAIGSGTLTYQWYLNDQAISGATQNTYSIFATSSSDDKNVYRVDVTDNNGTFSSDSATLTVETLIVLEILSQPTDQSVTEGEDAVFTVEATGGNGALTYQWYVNDSAISGATAESYSLVSTSSNDDGNLYRVDVIDDNGTLSSDSASLKVIKQNVPLTVASIGLGTIDSDKIAGPKWVRFNFEPLAAAPHTVSVSWDSDADVRFRVFEADGTQVSPFIQGSSPSDWSGELEDNAQYYIAIWSENGIANYDATIKATVPLSIEIQPFDRTVTQSDDVTFNVKAAGSGILSYQWFADGNSLPGETADSLTVFATSLSDNGTLYNVEVNNGSETVASEFATLTVNEPLATGPFSQAADTSTWILQGPAPTLDFKADTNTDAWGKTLLRIGDVLLVGGDFKGIKPARNAKPTARPFLAALDAVTGRPVSTFQVPDAVDNVVRALALSSNEEQIYVGGDFGLLVLDAETGALDFTVSVTRGNNTGRVFDIAVSDTQFYIGGQFTHVDNTFRANIARLSLDGDIDTSWNPSATEGYNNGRAAPVQSIAISSSGDTVYVGGNFKLINGIRVSTTPQNKPISLLSLSALDGSVLPERFSAFVGSNKKGLTVHDIVVTDYYVIIAWGGPNYVSFHSLDGARLVQYRAKGDVQVLQVVGDHVFVGHHGEFFGTLNNSNPPEAVVSIDPEIILPFKLHTFRIDDPSFLPEQSWQINGAFGVWGIAVSEDSIWVAGQISRAGSNRRAVDGLVRFPAL